MGLIKYFTSMTMVALFVIAIIIFSINFASDNQSDVLLSQDPDYANYKTNVEGNLTQVSVDVDTASEAFFTSTIKSGDEATVTGGQFKTGINSNIGIAKSSLSAGFRKIFGGDNSFGIILTSIMALLVFIGIAYGYYAWKGGSPD